MPLFPGPIRGRRCRLAWALVAIGLLLSARFPLGQAATITIFPTTVALGPKTPSAAVRLNNASTEETRFQVTLHAWSMSESGEMQLAPTQDLVAFPTVFAMKPFETRSIRVGSQKRAGAVELSYRMVIEELGPAPGASPAAGIRMLRRLNIPIFIEPADRQLKAELHDIAVPRAGVASLRVRNFGTTHFVVGEMTLEGRDSRDAIIASAKRDGWYVLPGDDIQYEIEFDQAACAQLANVTVSIRLRNAEVDSLSETATVAPGCGGP